MVGFGSFGNQQSLYNNTIRNINQLNQDDSASVNSGAYKSRQKHPQSPTGEKTNPNLMEP